MKKMTCASLALFVVCSYTLPTSAHAAGTTSPSATPTTTASPTATPAASPTPTATPTDPTTLSAATKLAAAKLRPSIPGKNANLAAIAFVQTFLKIKVTGTYDYATVKAIKSYQTSRMIPVNGQVMRQTWDSMLEAPMQLEKIPTGKVPEQISVTADVLETAQTYLGKKYILGATGPNAFDCSGLVQTSFKAHGVKLPRTSGQQYAATRRIRVQDLQPGDLLFYGYKGNQHVAIYLAPDKLIAAANSAKGVIISNPTWSWYTTNFAGAGRVITQPTNVPSPTASPAAVK